jgi:hypoxanthine phosphoribosyltransferase
MMNRDIEQVFYSEEQLAQVVQRIGAEISRDYAGKDLLMVGILKGSVVFMTDLMRALDIPCSIDFMVVSSYGAGSTSSGVVQIIKDIGQSIEGRDVLLVEDILDSGKTLSYVTRMLKTRNPASIRVCTLLDKPARRKADIQADYKGYDVPDEFIVGYGLDYAEKYRNLPYIGVLKRSVYEK